VSLLALAACTPAPGALVGASPAPPNVLIIVTDDQRIDSMQVMPRTLHWFRDEGTRFEHAFVTTPLCCPSRASIFTGRMAHNHGVHTNAQGDLLDERTTLQRYLQAVGYRTGIAGKYFNKWKLERDPGYFDRWAIFNSGYTGADFNIDGRPAEIDRYTTDFLRTWAGRFLRETERNDQQPWLLYVTPYAPHRPSTAAPRDADARIPPWHPTPAVSEQELGDKPPFVQAQGISPERGAEKRASQLRSLMAVDDLVDGLMEDLGRLGERGNTLAFFISDNGFFWSDHGLRDKRLPYLPSTEVPFYARWPGHLGEGVTDRRLVAGVDVAPTVFDAIGLPSAIDPPMDGRSLLSDDARTHLVLEYFEAGGRGRVPSWGSIVSKRFQYVEYDDPEGGVTFREYYDLHADPWELQNLLADGDSANDPNVAPLSQRLAAERACAGTTGPRACP
jgi:arylsulfatase A-like enzyme